MTHRRLRASAVILNLVALAACGNKGSTNKDAGAAVDSGPPAASATATGSSSSAPEPADAALPASEPPRIQKHYARVLHTGDSMVGGGLSRALGPMFVADGSKYFRDVIESGTIHEFSQNDHLPKLLKSINPDLILISLGANHIHQGSDPAKEIAPYVAKLIKRVEKIDCYWIAPPIWKPEQQAFNDWLKEHVAPCKFYDGTDPKGANLEISRRADKIHPDEKGGEVWAADFWKFFKGDGAFTETDADAGASILPDAGK